MRILNQSKKYMVNLENVEGLTAVAEESKLHAVRSEGKRILLGAYSSQEKTQAVLLQIFEHTGETFIMPQDEEVEV